MVEITCNTCSKTISKQNLIKYSGVGGYRKMCKPCRNKKSKEYGKKKSEAQKLFRSFYT